ncbi:choice-of-anchor D domain-containing protein [Silvibacterium acidisoli]|uniref:choice-of-anchor D domain-containing protein n=1 Tax=Acidobacteriaceae bacterium ZG23-2 TaxID=2883246 RepID=UPI00406C1551
MYARLGVAATTPSYPQAWQPVGPAYVNTSLYGAVTGRVTSIAVDSSDPSGNTVYVGTTGGGVWKSTDAAASSSGSVTFTPMTDVTSAFNADNEISLSIGALSVQPVSAGTEPVILAGTGDPNNATDSYYGAGILRSTNGGLTWSLITQSDDANYSGSRNFVFYGSGFSGFAWGTVNGSPVVVAAVSQASEGITTNATTSAYSMMGLYYSTDSGQSWRMATIEDSSVASGIVQSSTSNFGGCGASVAGASTLCGNAVTSVVWNPVRNRFYAAVQFHGYYESADGVTWTRLAAQPGTNLTSGYCPTNPGAPGSRGCPMLRGTLAVQPVTGDMFAITVDENNLDQGLWRDVCALSSGACSSASPAFVTRIADSAIEAGNLDSAVPATTILQADYDLSLAAVPSGQDTLLFVGTADLFRCSLAEGCAWRNATNSTTCAGAKVAPAQHAIDATAWSTQLLYFGNDGGLWRTTDDVNQQQAACSSDDATHFQNLNPAIGSLAEVENLAQDPTNPQNMMVSLGGLGTAAPQGADGWQQVLNGKGNYAAIDPVTLTNWYATSYFGVGINRCAKGAACTIADFGSPVIGNTQVDGDESEPVLAAPWILDPQNPANILLGTCRMWRGPATGGAGWSSANQISNSLDGIGGNSPCSGNALVRSLAASGSTSDAEGTPERVYAGMAGECDIASLGACDFSGGGTVPGHVFTASIDANSGSSTEWIDLFHSSVANGGAQNDQFNPGGFDISSLYVDPHDPTGQTVYATVEGFSGNGLVVAKVYASTDGGADWNNITSNLPDAPANSFVIDPNDANTAYVALDTGVYVTTSISSCAPPTSACWTAFGTSLPAAPVVQLATFNEGSTSVLRAATYGRGVWQTNLVTAGTTFASLTVSPMSLSFPGQAVQTASAAQSVQVTNTSNFTLNVSQIAVTGDFTETDTCAGPVAPGDACSISVSFDPTQTGTRSGTMTVYANIPTGQATVALSGEGLAASSVVLNPASLSFAQTLVGQTAQAQNVTISNEGGVPASLTSETVTGDFSISANTCVASLPAQTGCTVGISFTPTAPGNRSGALTVVDSSGTQTVPLLGIGAAPATDVLTPLSLAFPAQVIGTNSATQTVTLTNNGDQALQLIATQVSGDFSAINSCGTSLAGHTACAITVVFTPTTIGTEAGTLIVGDALRSQPVALTGVGVAPAGVSATPAAVNFGNFGVGQTSPEQTVTVTNNGGVALTGLQPSIAGDFTLVQGPNPCGQTLAVGVSCGLGVVFKPSVAGARTGNVTVDFTNLGHPLNVTLAGNGEDFSLQVAGSSSATITSGQTATYSLQILPINGSTGTVALACAGAPANSSCSVNPASVTLSGESTASATVTVITGKAPSTAQERRSESRGWGVSLALLLPLGILAVRRRGAVLRCVCLAILLCLVPSGCNLGVTPGKNTTGSTPPPANSTPSGTYTLPVTGAAPGLSHSVQLTLNVE